MSSLPRYLPHYTVDDYRQWKGDWELIDGLAIAMTPSPFGPHERIVSRLSRMVGNQIEKANCCCEVYTNLDWIVSHDTVIRPDMMVVCGEQPQRHLEKTPALLAEVLSETTRSRDLLAKRAICHQQRVPNFLIIDPDAKSVERIFAMGTRVYGDNDLVEIELDESCRSPITIECSKLFE